MTGVHECTLQGKDAYSKTVQFMQPLIEMISVVIES